MHAYRVEAWTPGNGVAFSADVADYFQATNVFTCACRQYLRVQIVRLSDGTVERDYNNT